VSADRDLELHQLRTFVAVARRRSFTRAAEDLHIAQQAVSQQIKALERSVGVALLRRSSRRVDLTAEGAVFLADLPARPYRGRPRHTQSQGGGTRRSRHRPPVLHAHKRLGHHSSAARATCRAPPATQSRGP
jgi:DNA-binding MarR family transcriptional regulator